ncbi:MAG: magnesium/cobalt transporter CorA [Deltaproteobacteria bacterium]|nr:magnesium/cobalt transporter CorA [Deltaproteobacteria bacterium]
MGTRILIFDGQKARPQADLNDARAALGRPGVLVWIDLDERTSELERFLDQDLKLHPLTQEDLWTAREAPKLEQFPHYLLALVHGARVAEQPGASGDAARIRTQSDVPQVELDCVLGDNWLLTHHPPLPLVREVQDELVRHPEALAKGPHVMLHAVLDRLVDLHLPLLDAFDRAIEGLEEDALKPRPPRSTLRRVLDLRRVLHRLRRSAVHQREVLLKLARGDAERIPKDALPFFRDVYDHYARVADLLEDDRDMLANVSEAWMSTASLRMNEIMKVLTLISTLMLPVTFIAGVYGMNFEGIPELKWRYGYLYAWGLMAGTAGGLLWWFKRRGWFD